MKRTLSIILSFVMLLSITAGLPVFSYAKEPEVTDFTFAPAGEITVTEYSNHDVSIPDGSSITVYYDNGTSTALYFRENELFTADGDSIYSTELSGYVGWGQKGTVHVTQSTPQYWTKDNSQLDIYVKNIDKYYPVQLIESPVASISVKLPDSYFLTVNQRGYTKKDSSGNEYFVYDYSLRIPDSQITVNYKDSTTKVFINQWYEGSDWAGYEYIAEDGTELNIYDLIVNTNQDSEHWTLGYENYVEYEYFGAKTKVAVAITNGEAPVWPVHTHNYKLTSSTPATCIEDGLSTYVCPCGDIKTEVINATGKHTSDKGTVTKAATYTEAGVKIYKCTVCGTVVKTEAIPKLSKKANKFTAKGKTVTVKLSKLKKKNQTVAQKNAFNVCKAQGKITYVKSSGNKKITVAKNGVITVKKGLKKGTYKIGVKVTAAGNNEYKSATKTVTVTIKVK